MGPLIGALFCLAGVLGVSEGAAQPDRTPQLPSVDSVLEAAADAMGGQAAITRLRSVEAIADGRSPGGHYRMEIRSTRDGRVEFRHESAGGQSEVIVANGEKAWSRDERTGEIGAVDAGTVSVVRAHDFSMIAVDFASRYADLTVDGVEWFGGERCFRLRGRDEAGNEVESFFGAGSCLLKGQRVPDASRPGSPPVRISFDEWRRVDGVLLPARVTATDQKGDFVLSFTTLAVNGVDERIFDVPDERGAAAVPVPAPPSPRPGPERH
jgi:hypothetical protein